MVDARAEVERRIVHVKLFLLQGGPSVIGSRCHVEVITCRWLKAFTALAVDMSRGGTGAVGGDEETSRSPCCFAYGASPTDGSCFCSVLFCNDFEMSKLWHVVCVLCGATNGLR